MNILNMPTEETQERVARAIEKIAGITSTPKRYGIRINKNDSNPATRIEYIYDAVDFTPAKMNFASDKFEYGDWGNIWFVRDNYPVMVGFDGKELYRVNPNDYSKKLDGTASNHHDEAIAGNLMSSMPLVYVKQWESDNFEYFVVCQEKYDESYKAYPFTREDGTVMDKMYLSVYRGYDDGEKLRSLHGKQPMHTKTATVEISKAKANGVIWNTRTWAQRDLVNNLLTLISRHDNSQTQYGNGNLNYQAALTPTMGVLETGTLDTNGQFYGKNDNVTQVKVFHIEAWWADQWERIQGLLNINGLIHVKMTPPYNLTGAGFTNIGRTPSGTTGGFISNSKMSEFGRVSFFASGTSATYQCDGLWFNNAFTAVARVGGDCYVGVRSGASAVHLAYAGSDANWHFGAALSCEMPLG